MADKYMKVKIGEELSADKIKSPPRDLEKDKGTATMWPNDKAGNPKRPDWSGYMYAPSGKFYQIAAWINDVKHQPQVVSPSTESTSTTPPAGEDDDVPW